ncbi:Protein of unknown function [Bacillus wiedmannii]|nr:Protein of unknown function [Bacillus wiedmannii]
MQEEEVAIW